MRIPVLALEDPVESRGEALGVGGREVRPLGQGEPLELRIV